MSADGLLFGDLARRQVIDLFAGGGGASEGMTRAGFAPTVAVNHDADAIRMHAANHPGTMHYQESVYDVRPGLASRGRPVCLLWASPQCTHFSRARGGVPKSEQSRSLAWVVVDWAREVKPACIIVENVPEWVTWGPLGDDGQPIPERKGKTFRAFVVALESEGYTVEWRNLIACDYGAPTSRKRLYLVARRGPVSWPAPTHGKGRTPYRTAAECIDWSIPIPSIFGRKKPLADATCRRIAQGVKRFVLDSPSPFLLNLSHGGRLSPLTEPMGTLTAGPEGGDRCLVSPSLVHMGNGEREGQSPRVYDIGRPLGTVVAGGGKHGLVAAFLARHFTGCEGGNVGAPMPTVTTVDHNAVAACYLTAGHAHGWDRPSTSTQAANEPLPTILGKDARLLCAAFLTAYYGTDEGHGLRSSLPAVVTHDRFGLVTVTLDGEPWVLSDIGMRMLQPRELARAQGFRDDYILTGTKSSQVARIGNSVCPDVAEALVRANAA